MGKKFSAKKILKGLSGVTKSIKKGLKKLVNKALKPVKNKLDKLSLPSIPGLDKISSWGNDLSSKFNAINNPFSELKVAWTNVDVKIKALNFNLNASICR